MKKHINLPVDQEARRCVLICIETHIGVIESIEGNIAHVRVYTNQEEDGHKPDYVVAFVEKFKAIDLTPIYKITMTEDVEKGDVLRFDTAEFSIGTDRNGAMK